MIVYKEGEVTEEGVLRRPNEDEVVFAVLMKPSEDDIKEIVGDMFGCHPLVVEDCLYKNQRPKVDVYDDHAFIPFYVIKKEWNLVEVSIVMGKNYVLAIFPEEMQVLKDVRRDFLRSEKNMESTGFILYHLLDVFVDEYFALIDKISNKISDMEDEINENPHANIAYEILSTKRKLQRLRKVFSDERSVLETLMHAKFPYTKEETNVFFMDVYDHVTRVIDNVDMASESMTGLLNFQIAKKSDELNGVMKVLAVINTIFLPITFIVGLYGVNLKGVPEYNWSQGYAFMWGLMIVVTAITWIFIKKKKWL